MRVLVVHNRYSSRMPSGENLVVDDEVRWLRAAGLDVDVHEATNDDLLQPGIVGRARDGVEAIWSWSAARRFTETLEARTPDVVHVHNLFPLLTASVPRAAVRLGIPVVWSVHNRRTVCVAGGNFRDGRPCHDCRPGWRTPGILHGCYASSRPASALVTGATSAFRHVARRTVDAVAISEHMRRWLVDEGGFDLDRTHVKYNGVEGPDSTRLSPAHEQRDLLFVGRLAGYKGVSTLLAAWKARGDVDATLRIVGDGPLAADVRSAADSDDRIVWLGQLPSERVAAETERARVVVVPSLWSEPFGRVAAEAMAFARPVVSSGTGALAEIVDEQAGWTAGTSVEGLVDAIRHACKDSDDVIAAKAGHARHRYLERFSPDATTTQLEAIYRTAIDRARRATSGGRRDPDAR